MFRMSSRKQSSAMDLDLELSSSSASPCPARSNQENQIDPFEFRRRRASQATLSFSICDRLNLTDLSFLFSFFFLNTGQEGGGV